MDKEKNPYKLTIVSLYINYILQGMATIIITQNMVALMNQLKTDTKGISLVVSFIGLGRILSLFIAGKLSDKVGRKLVIWLGMGSYFIFFAGIILSTNITMALISTLFAGFANAFLDTGTYPTLIEAYPDKHAFLSVLNKFFISTGQFILPLLVNFLTIKNLSYKYSFIACLVILTINSVNMIFRKYPNQIKVKEEEFEESAVVMAEQPIFWFEGLFSILFGFTSVSTFNIVLMWLPEFGEKIASMTHESSLMLVSVYSVGSIISVFLTSFLVKKFIKPINMVIYCTLLSVISLIVLVVFPNPLICLSIAFCIGVFASGGIWQLVLSIFLEMFPNNKGENTGYYTLATSVSVMVIPIITGYLNEISSTYVFIFNILVTFIGFVSAVIIKHRYKKVFPKIS